MMKTNNLFKIDSNYISKYNMSSFDSYVTEGGRAYGSPIK
jgi:hypothetical protein